MLRLTGLMIRASVRREPSRRATRYSYVVPSTLSLGSNGPISSPPRPVTHGYHSTSIVSRGASGTAGRIVMWQTNAGKNKSNPRLCVGCGSQIVSGTTTGIAAGADGLSSELSTTQAKKARYLDITDNTTGSFLCCRCRALQNNNIWKAYDALRDVEPKVFLDQLKHIVSRRKFGLCIMVVDATDSEHTAVNSLRKAIGSTPVVLAINKIDLLPRMNHRDRQALAKKTTKSVKCIGSYAVSAETGAGLVALARGILEKLGGRDVFVVGAANVGKSSLVKKLSLMLCRSVHLKGSARQAANRRQLTADLKVTGSNLPGTTLQAVRVPCFSSRDHAMWDTPGIINAKALQYRIFPSHLMEPLTRPGHVQVPTKENGKVCELRPGQCILIESTWMGGNDDDDEQHGDSVPKGDDDQCVLGRVDLVGAEGKSVLTQAYLHPSLRIRIVPISKAPSVAAIPQAHIHRVKKLIREATGNHETGLADAYSFPLKSFKSDVNKSEEMVPGEKEMENDRYRMDIVFASLGWISFTDSEKYAVVPRCVEGSVFSKRLALYPINMTRWLEEHDTPEHIPDELDEETMRELRHAAKEGRHMANRKEIYHKNDEEYYEDEWYQSERIIDMWPIARRFIIGTRKNTTRMSGINQNG